MNEEERKRGVAVTIGMILIVIFAFWTIWWGLPAMPDIIPSPAVTETPTPTPTAAPVITPTPENDTDRRTTGYDNGTDRDPDPNPRGVNIMVAGEDPWNTAYVSNLSGMFPGNLIYTEVPVENIGHEAARVWVRTVVTNESGGNNRYANVASSEPEYTDCGGFEVGGYVERCNLSGSIIYGIMVMFGSSANVIIDPYDEVMLDDVDGTWLYLGRMSVGESVNVRQTYFMIGEMSNWAQGDIMTFDLEFYAVSLDGVDP